MLHFHYKDRYVVQVEGIFVYLENLVLDIYRKRQGWGRTEVEIYVIDGSSKT